MNHRKILYIGAILLAVLTAGYIARGDIKPLLMYGFGDKPTHEANSGCEWVKRTFVKITLFEQNCTDSSLNSPLSEDSDGSIIQTQPTEYGYSFKLQLFAKSAAQNPLDIVNEWYSKLTPEQKRVCEIQDADERIDYFHDGRPNWSENPHPMPYKTRYKIDIKPTVLQEILDKYGGYPGNGEGYDYLCGKSVSTTFGGHPPYFEFDDRSPDKYLLVGTYGQEGPLVDLNSIRF